MRIASAGLILSHTTAAAAATKGSATQPSSGTSPTLLSKQRTLGRGDAALTVSALSLGIMGMQGGRGRTPPEPMMEKLIQQAYDRGCTFFDTAEGYSAGSNEELLGRAVAPFRDKVIIGTKFTVDLTKNPPINDNRPERVKAACEGSLRRLKIFEHLLRDPFLEDLPLEVVAVDEQRGDESLEALHSDRVEDAGAYPRHVDLPGLHVLESSGLIVWLTGTPFVLELDC